MFFSLTLELFVAQVGLNFDLNLIDCYSIVS